MAKRGNCRHRILSGLKSKFSSIESCFGSGIHYPSNPNFRVLSPVFGSGTHFPLNPNVQVRGPSVFSESVQFCPVQSNFLSLGFIKQYYYVILYILFSMCVIILILINYYSINLIYIVYYVSLHVII